MLLDRRKFFAAAVGAVALAPVKIEAKPEMKDVIVEHVNYAGKICKHRISIRKYIRAGEALYVEDKRQGYLCGGIQYVDGAFSQLFCV